MERSRPELLDSPLRCHLSQSLSLIHWDVQSLHFFKNLSLLAGKILLIMFIHVGRDQDSLSIVAMFGMRDCLVGLLGMAPAGGLIPIDDSSWRGSELESVTQKWRQGCYCVSFARFMHTMPKRTLYAVFKASPWQS